MKAEDLLHKIRYEKGYHPFHHDFKAKRFKELLDATEFDEMDSSLLDSAIYFHEEFHAKLTKQVDVLISQLANSELDHIKELIVATANEQDRILKEYLTEFLDKLEGPINVFDIQNSSITMENEPNNPQNLMANSEAVVDMANMILQLLNYRKGINKDIKISEERNINYLEIAHTLFKLCNTYYNIKRHYDNCLYHKGKITLLIEQNQIHFDGFDKHQILVQQIGKTVVQELLLAKQYALERKLKNHDPSIIALINRKPESKTLGELEIKNGFVTKYSLRGRKAKDQETCLDFLCVTEQFYNFYNDNPIPSFFLLKVSNLLTLFNELNTLISYLYKMDRTEIEVNNGNYIKSFLPKIKHGVMKSYLLAVTGLEDNQVEKFIELISQNGSGNVYERPLIKAAEGYYYFTYTPLIAANYHFLIDYWLEQGDISLDARGTELEHFIKHQLKNSNSPFSYKLADRTMFEVTNDNYEEIDLLINTSKTLLIGEVKCIKYPMEDRDYFGILSKVINTAVKQLKRKEAFLKKYHRLFEKELLGIEDKNIVKVIILNLPVLTGLSVEGIPIVDSRLFLSYFQSGRLSHKIYGAHNGVNGYYYYYRNEDEFCDNMEAYLACTTLFDKFYQKTDFVKRSYSLTPNGPIISYYATSKI